MLRTSREVPTETSFRFLVRLFSGISCVLEVQQLGTMAPTVETGSAAKLIIHD